MKIIDFHVHAFPDKVAERAMPQLEAKGNIKAALDGKLDSLIRSMDVAGIETSVICSIATKPEQFQPILDWSRKIASPRIVPLASVHPRDPLAAARVAQVAAAGLKGVKLHPYYQDFDLDEERLMPIYAEIQRHNLLLVSHTGFDMAFPFVRRADAARLAAVFARFPNLRFIATHLGAWKDWGLAWKNIIGKPVYIETSFALPFMPPEEARRLLAAHPADYILFGSDSPWADQAEAAAQLRALGLPAELQRRILRDNALHLLR